MSKRIKELHAAFSNVFAFIYPLRLINKDNGNFFTPLAQLALTHNEAQKANNFIWWLNWGKSNKAKNLSKIWTQ